ncbi:GNAT family N-acetyltransferase [Lactovum odontotermitis]
MELKALNRSQLREVADVWQAAEDYARLEDGADFDALASAKEFFDALPPGKTYADKRTLGVYKAGQLVGLVDLAENYPVKGTLFLGLLLLVPAARGQNTGNQVHQSIIRKARQENYEKLRLGVLENNPRALKFWRSQGYKVLKQTKSLDSRANPVYLMELDL